MRRFLVAVVLLSLAWTGSAAASPVPASGPRVAVDDVFCDILALPKGTDAVHELVSLATRRRYSPNVLSSLALEFVAKNCDDLLADAPATLAAAFSGAPVDLSRSKVLTGLPIRAKASDVVAQLSKAGGTSTPAVVERAAASLCEQVERPSEAISDDPIRSVFGTTGMRSVFVGRTFVAFTQSRCGLDSSQAETLLGRVDAYLVRTALRTETSDVVGPTMLGPWLDDAAPLPELRWKAFDAGSGVGAYDVAVFDGTRWSVTRTTAQRWLLFDQVPGEHWYAVAAIDTAGNKSGWSYLSVVFP